MKTNFVSLLRRKNAAFLDIPLSPKPVELPPKTLDLMLLRLSKP
jgi:hypothetical protein